ncbi:MAG: bifunctional diguanylate cyclase/phosphodiesterase [Sphingomicrobium sp.]
MHPQSPVHSMRLPPVHGFDGICDQMVKDEQPEVAPSEASDWITEVAHSPIAHVLAGAGIGVFQIDMAMGRATWDEVTGEILGLGAVAQLDPVPMPIHDDDLADVSRRLDRISKGGGKRDVELRIVRRSGEVRWVRATARQAPGDHAKGRYVVGVLTDVTERHRECVMLAEAERGVSDLLDSLPHMIWSADAAGNSDYVSTQWIEFTGRDPRASWGQGWAVALHPEDRDAALARWLECVRTLSRFDAEVRFRSRSGEYRWFSVIGVPRFNAASELTCWRGTSTDIQDRVLAQNALDDSERLSRAIIEATPDCMSLLDADGTVLFVNQPVLAAHQVEDPSELLEKRWTGRFARRLRIRAEAELKRAQEGGIGRLSVRGGATGDRWFDVMITPIYNANGRLTRLLAVSRDVTEQKKAQEEAEWSANHDALTGLPNRALAQKVIDGEFAKAGGDGPRLGLILLDADHLKRVNDGLGHDAGDAMLCEIARRLKAAVPQATLVARLGGDEFAVVISDAMSEADLVTKSDLLMSALAKPFSYAGRLIDCHASGGAAVIGCHSRTRVELMKNADIALYGAKRAGRGNVKIFEPAIRLGVQRRDLMLNLASDALNEGRILAYYQPKVDLRTGKVAGLEALLRWEHDRLGVQGPDAIAAAFEDLRIATRMSDRMVEAVVRDIVRWREQQFEFGHVALNAAAAELRLEHFADRLLDRLAAANIPPNQIQLEVTETVFLGRGAEHVHQALELLSAGGVTIALDDFGTGYASLPHLREFPIAIIKIDRSFVRDIGTTDDARAIVGAVVSLGTNLNMEIVAEGIETSEQESALRQLGCHYGQGFLYAKALPASRMAEEFTRLNAKRSSEIWTAPRRAA